MDDKTKINIYRKHIVYLALSTRLAIITLQFISNILIFDHEPDVFRSPKESLNVTLFDRITNIFLGGFLRWDAQYFYHIAKYGYTFENTLAFFPLYPLITRYIAIPILTVFPFLDWDSIALIIFVVLNIFFFTKASLALFDLSSILLNRKIAYRATILFCVNPATVFFVAPYTECMFSYFTFWSMLKCAENYYNPQKNIYSSFGNLLSISFPIALSVATRSNGMLNIGFLIYFWILYFKKIFWPHNIGTLINLLKCGFLLLINIAVCITPFLLIQIFAYKTFCTDFETDLPKNIIDFAKENNYVLPGTFSKHNQSWCLNTFPMAYAYIQQHYWGVGFLEYYELKQVPNFLLALPIICLIVTCSVTFVKQNLNYCLNLGIFEYTYSIQTKDDEIAVKTYDHKMFIFILHAIYLTIFCILFVHVQVTTRMLCSASPILYWFCAYAFDTVSSVEYDLLPSWKCFLFTNELNLKQKFIKYYFLSYFFIGTIMFSNNYPWT